MFFRRKKNLFVSFVWGKGNIHLNNVVFHDTKITIKDMEDVKWIQNYISNMVNTTEPVIILNWKWM